ncbi:MAG: GNAT family N-acetyltransferase [Bryobacteraceae bacterium]|jgi:CelD/BcsL family acetyltransferase involved in cellulose biosynthesis
MLAAIPSAIADRAQLTVERVSEVAAFEALRQEWDDLLKASDSACVFLTWEWLFTWWRYLKEDWRLSILAVRRGSELVALAPFGVRPRSVLRGRPFPVLEFLGSGFAGSDYLDVIIRNGSEAEARQALISHLAQERLPLKLTNLKKGESVAAGVLAGLSEKGWTSAEAKTNVCPFIPLAGLTWDSYLGSLSAEHRYNFNRKWRRLNRDYDVRFEQMHTEEQSREALDLLVAQHNTRWSARGGSDAFHTIGLVAFHREWTVAALKRGWLRLYVLRLNEKPAACLYGLRHCGTFYFYQSSFDAAYMQSSVGLISMGLAIQRAIEEGAEEYDLLHGSETYKSHWSRHSRDLARLELFPPSSAGRFCRLSVELGRASRALARRMTPREQAT